MEFEIINLIDENVNVFKAEIEIISTRERRFFCYPKGEGWDDEIDNKPRFIADIQHRLKKEESKKDLNINTIKSKIKGNKYNSEEKSKKKKINIQKEAGNK